MVCFISSFIRCWTVGSLHTIPVLAGLLIPVGFNIIDWKALKHLRIIPKSDAVVLIIVLLITTFGNLIYAVGIGVVLSCVLS
jgi:SulP family sulfate permease